MTTQDFTTTILLHKTANEVFDAINNVRGWWSEEIEGNTDQLGDEWTYHYGDVHRCRMKIIESVPGKKIVWLVMDNHFSFTKDKTEWIGNKIVFEITEKDNATQLRFSQIGLVPAYECYDICHKAWNTYIQQSLYNLVSIGKGKPNAK